MRRFLFVVVILAWLPAGQILALPLGDETQCVPPGMPAFRTWELRAAKSIALADENDKEQPGLWAFFTAKNQEIASIWVGNVLVSVDPNPRDANAPGWHDRGAVLPDTTLRAERRSTCDWFQPLNLEKAS